MTKFDSENHNPDKTQRQSRVNKCKSPPSEFVTEFDAMYRTLVSRLNMVQEKVACMMKMIGITKRTDGTGDHHSDEGSISTPNRSGSVVH